MRLETSVVKMRSIVDNRSLKTMATSLIVVVETVKNCSPKPSILRNGFLSAERKQWKNQSDSRVFKRTWSSWFLLKMYRTFHG